MLNNYTKKGFSGHRFVKLIAGTDDYLESVLAVKGDYDTVERKHSKVRSKNGYCCHNREHSCINVHEENNHVSQSG